MRRVLALRHAKAAPPEGHACDHERDLAESGRADAQRLGLEMRGFGLSPRLILTSSANRARQTAAMVARALGYEGAVVDLDELYAAAEPGDYLRVISARAGNADSVLVVGHNPVMEDLVSLMAGERVGMKTCTLAELEVDVKDWADLGDDTAAQLCRVMGPDGVIR